MKGVTIKVLIIEDDKIVATMLKELLTNFGYEVVCVVDSAEQALIDFGLYQPHIVLVDIHLSGVMTGIDFVHEVKKIGSVPIIYLSAYIDDEIIGKIKETYPVGYIRKPFENHELKVTMEIAVHSYLQIQKNLKKLQDEIAMNAMQINELVETNNHLVSATFRERSLRKELEVTKDAKRIIEEQNKKIQDSINYSLKIQQSIIPSHNAFQLALNNYFVFYRPKDVVSGDFPWLFERDEFVYFAAIDCTGHGVPGAMMSMIGYLLLNAIVKEGESKTPSEILKLLHESVVSTLKQDQDVKNSSDGMDASLCRIDMKKKQLLFSGAHLPLLHLRNDELNIYKGDKFPVGGMQYRNKNAYTDNLIELEIGDKIFVYSDGIIDQIGGEENRKWMSSGLKEFIVQNRNCSMDSFHDKIAQYFESYKGDNKQIDDVLLIGFEA